MGNCVQWLVTLRRLLLPLKSPIQLFTMEQHPLGLGLSGIIIQTRLTVAAFACRERALRGEEETSENKSLIPRLKSGVTNKSYSLCPPDPTLLQWSRPPDPTWNHPLKALPPEKQKLYTLRRLIKYAFTNKRCNPKQHGTAWARHVYCK